MVTMLAVSTPIESPASDSSARVTAQEVRQVASTPATTQRSR